MKKSGLFEIVGTNDSLAPTTIRNYHDAVSVVFSQAVKEMLIPYNPAERSTPPARRAEGRRSLQPDEIAAILDALELEPIDFRTMINILIVSGIRRGELYALKWSKIDFERQEMVIDRSVGYLQDRGMFEGPTKTGNERYIALPQQTLDLLKKYRAWQATKRLQAGDLWINNDLVFTGEYGGFLYPPLINSRLSNFCKKNGFQHIHPHIFHHSVASILLSSGVDVLTISKMLGHANPSMTLGVYAHEIAGTRRKTAECISNAILDRKKA